MIRGVLRARVRRIALVLLASAIWGTSTAMSAANPILNLRDGAGDVKTVNRITAINDWWVAKNPGKTPCRKCEIRPDDSQLVWTYYRRQGFFPNWVRAARDLLRRDRAGEVEGFRAGVDEIVAFSTRRVSPDGLPYRINESAYLSSDSTPPPWRDAMGQGLILTLFVEAIPANPTQADLDKARTLVTEYLNSFVVHWSVGGVGANGSAGGRWYLEYATPRGEKARVLNGFMQTLVSLDRFAGQADTLSTDPEWAALRDRAREYVRLGALELNAHLDKYDYGRDKLSRYSLAKPDPAPPLYQTYHRQLLLRLQDVDYLPKEWREHFSSVRVQWGGAAGGFEYVQWWTILLAAIAVAVILAVLRRRVVVQRRSRRRPIVSEI